MANSGHHQGVADAGDLMVVARADDGLIEAVELPGASFSAFHAMAPRND